MYVCSSLYGVIRLIYVRNLLTKLIPNGIEMVSSAVCCRFGVQVDVMFVT